MQRSLMDSSNSSPKEAFGMSTPKEFEPLQPTHTYSADDTKADPHDSFTMQIHQKTPKQPMKRRFSDTSGVEKGVFVLLFLRELTAYTSNGLMAPLFPSEAENKGISTTVSGWIFGIFPLVQFLASPLAGRLIPVLGAKCMLVTGSLLYGIATVAFGCLDYMEVDGSPLVYIVICFIIRISMALGNAVAVTAVYAVSTYTFSGNPATALGILELAVGAGMMAGPLIGGALYQTGGFAIPFIVVGSVIIALVPLYMLVINIDILPAENSTTPFSRLLCVPSIALISLAVMLSAALWGSLDPTLEPYLEQYNLSVFKMSLVFLLMAGTYALVSPLIGLAADKMSDSNPPIILGFLILSVFYLILGSSPIFSFKSKLWVDLVSLTMIAIGLSLSSVPNIAKMIASARDAGIEESIALHGAVAGLYNGVYALGDAIGPVLCSLATELHGFPRSTSYCAIVALCMMLFLVILWIYEHRIFLRQCFCIKCKRTRNIPTKHVATEPFI